MSYENYFNPTQNPNPGNYYTSSWSQGLNPWPSQLTSNKILVTSLDEAIAKSSIRNSETVYFHQSQPVIYIVRIDMNGVKSWAQLDYSTGQQDTNAPATKADITALNTKLEALMSKFGASEPTKKKKKEAEVATDESNG